MDPAAVGRDVAAWVDGWLEARPGAGLHPDFKRRVEVFATALATWGVKTNLTSNPGDPLKVAFHLGDSVIPLALSRSAEPGILATAFDRGRSVLDVGSGGGFPGLVLAAATDADFTLVESRQKRASFLRTVSLEMGLGNVRVQARRISPGDFAGEFDVVMTRALGQPGNFLAIAGHALREGGVAIIYASAAQQIDPQLARRAGLGEFIRYAFELHRDYDQVQRAIFIWRK
ncbi:MAG: 16S rRNA (guanine(527)-N(7))-methyltransferase RsmG [Candidatus Binataceae bacterium]